MNLIVATKLHIPRPRAALVPRPRLVRRLSEGLRHVLTLVTAPAGYGKTTLLGEWAKTLDMPVAWVSLDRGDNDLLRFWTHTLAALQQACPSLHEQAALRLSAKDRTGDSLILALLNGLHRMSQPIVLIWDDIHVIENPAIQQGISYFLNRLPPQVHLYMAGRTKPALQLARLKVQEGLNHIDVDELRFDAAETADFFSTCAGMTLSVDELNPIRERTEGWIAAMRLAVLSMDGETDPAAMVRKLSGAGGDLSDYFFEEVLTRQPEPLQQFLLRTAILDRMTGGLCEAVTGMADSAACLQ